MAASEPAVADLETRANDFIVHRVPHVALNEVPEKPLQVQSGLGWMGGPDSCSYTCHVPCLCFLPDQT